MTVFFKRCRVELRDNGPGENAMLRCVDNPTQLNSNSIRNLLKLYASKNLSISQVQCDVVQDLRRVRGCLKGPFAWQVFRDHAQMNDVQQEKERRDAAGKVFHLGACRIDVRTHSIQFPDGAPTPLQSKFLEVLLTLAKRHPDMVSREEMIAEVWNGNSYVGQSALTNAIWQLRQVLNNHEDTRDCIETFRKSGYRLTVQPVWSDTRDPDTRADAPLILSEGVGEHVAESLEVQRAPPRTWLAGRRLAITGTAIVVLMLTLGWRWWGLNSAPSEPSHWNPPFVPQQVTHDSGRELFPKISLDGQRLAYLRVGKNGHRALALRSAAGEAGLGEVLSAEDVEVWLPAWDVDGQHLLYSAVSKDRQRCEIRRLSMQDQRETVVTHCDPARGTFAVSPDGRWLSVARNRQIYLLDRRQPEATETILPCNAPCVVDAESDDHAFSPDSQSIAFDRNISALVEDLFVVRIADGETRRLTFGNSDIRGIAWHPDGQRIVYAVQNARRREGYVVPSEGGLSTPLDLDGFSFPNFANDGSLFFYVWFSHAHLGAIDMAMPERILPFHKTRHDFRLSDYSKMSRRLVFVSNETGHDEIWSSDLDGGSRRKLTSLSVQVTFPRWSPDGKRVMFSAQAADFSGDELLILNVADAAIQKVPFANKALLRANWTRDGQSALVSVLNFGRNDLYRVHLTTGYAQKLTDDGASLGVELPDLSVLYARQANDGLWRLRQGYAPERVIAEPCNTRFNWILIEDEVFCEERRPESHRLHVVPLQAGPARLLTELRKGQIDDSGGFAWDPETKRLLVTFNEPAEADLMRVRHPAFLNPASHP